MTTKETANRLIELCNTGQFEKAQDDLYHPDAISIEPDNNDGMGSVKGIEAIKTKGKKWDEMVEEFHGAKISEPIVADNHFAFTHTMDVTLKGQGRVKMEEISVYEIRDGKIVKEQFFYSNSQ